MLPREENELLTRTDPRTPCGELMRRYWQPAALAEELPVGGAPMPVRLLGEDLVLFRDEQGRPGLLGLHCSHRGADLSYGRLEDGGLRCIYHGWLYDVHGRCLEQPGEPALSIADSGLRSAESAPAHSPLPNPESAIKHTAYPCVERAGVIFAYLGPGDPPEFPNYEFLSVPLENIYVIKRYHECNYLQANEGNIDLSHLSFLHYMSSLYRGAGGPPPGEPLCHQGAAPGTERPEVELTPYGVRSCKIRREPDPAQAHLFVTEFVLPNFTAFWVGPDRDQRGQLGYSVNWHVPIDDTHHWKYTFTFGRGWSVESERMRFRTEMIDYRPIRNLGNGFLQDRGEMEKESYTGIGSDFQVHDKWATESQGPIQDRMAEHLGALDLPLVAARKVLLSAIQDLEEGREPANVIRDPARNHLPIVTCSVAVPAATDWKEYCRELERLNVTRASQ